MKIGKTLNCSLKVYIDDVNDNYPVFTHDDQTFNIKSSEMHEGMFIGNVTAIDNDLGKNGFIYYIIKESNGQDFESFRVNSLTGLYFYDLFLKV